MSNDRIQTQAQCLWNISGSTISKLSQQKRAHLQGSQQVEWSEIGGEVRNRNRGNRQITSSDSFYGVCFCSIFSPHFVFVIRDEYCL